MDDGRKGKGEFGNVELGGKETGEVGGFTLGVIREFGVLWTGQGSGTFWIRHWKYFSTPQTN